MPPGLMAAQAGHAFLASFLSASPAETAAYLGPDGWTKIVLAVADDAALRQAHKHAMALRLPCALWVESEFKGSPFPVATALGIGPVLRAAARPVTQGLARMK